MRVPNAIVLQDSFALIVALAKLVPIRISPLSNVLQPGEKRFDQGSGNCVENVDISPITPGPPAKCAPEVMRMVFSA